MTDAATNEKPKAAALKKPATEKPAQADATLPPGKAIEVVTEDGEIISGLPMGYDAGNQSLAVSLARAEVDQQIATARAMPRSISRAVANILTLATLDEESAEECVYALPRGGKPIKGPSVRMAEIIASQWGNCRVGARVVHVDRFEKYVEAEGVFHDLETNAATTARIRRRISDKRGKLFNEDMIVVTGNAACAIAKRNAILGAVPKAVWRKAYTAVEGVLSGEQKTLAERRDIAISRFGAFGVTAEQIFAALGVEGLEDVTLEHLSTLTGMRSALKSGESTVEEMFPRQGGAVEGEKKDLNSALDALAGNGNGAEKVTSTAPDEGGAVAGAAASPADGSPELQLKSGGSQPEPEKAAEPKPEAQLKAEGSAAGEDPQGVADSYEAGISARASGKPRKSIPKPLQAKGREHEAKAWYAGWDQTDKELADEEKGGDDEA